MPQNHTVVSIYLLLFAGSSCLLALYLYQAQCISYCKKKKYYALLCTIERKGNIDGILFIMLEKLRLNKLTL